MVSPKDTLTLLLPAITPVSRSFRRSDTILNRIHVYLPEPSDSPVPVLDSEFPLSLTIDGVVKTTLFTKKNYVVTATHAVRFACKHRLGTPALAVYRPVGPAPPLPSVMVRLLAAPCLAAVRAAEKVPPTSFRLWEMTGELGPMVSHCWGMIKEVLRSEFQGIAVIRKQIPILKLMDKPELLETKFRKIASELDPDFVELTAWLGVDLATLAEAETRVVEKELLDGIVRLLKDVGYDHEAAKRGMTCYCPGVEDYGWEHSAWDPSDYTKPCLFDQE
ncbi:hypothetical protein HKX48_004392 [Thoreauomyces humboldtii]|nr:hypothetical protein HKX48_004392 [Thoreauomyces humboldtii]